MNANGLGIVFHLISLAVVFFASFATEAFAQIYHVKDMNTEQIRALDRETTVVILPGGILEQHGPYLPSFTDGYMNERLTQDLANAIVERPGWKVLVFPIIPRGAGGANIIGEKYVFPGSYAVRPSTLRAVFMDLATELGEQGFRWIFIVHLHGGTAHNGALNQAGDYFDETYKGHMVNLTGHPLAFEARRDEVFKLMSEEERREDASSTRAGLNETSRLLFLRPDLVNPDYKNAPPITPRDQKHRIEMAKEENWPGYFGSPRLASASFGAKAWRQVSSGTIDLALKILDGFDYKQAASRSERKPVPALAASLKAFREHIQKMERKQQEWLREKGME